MTFSLWSDEQEKPIQHLRVIDLTVMLPGAYLTRLLAQYGADVIKIENLPSGDPTRAVPNTALAEFLNQGKKSVALDLKSEKGVELVHQLATEADVFVENFREGVMEGLGLGYAELSENNPDLLYFSLRGFHGKNSVHAGHDLNFIATSGVGEWFLESGPNYSTQFGDIVGGTLVPAMKLLFHLANPGRRGMHLVSHMDESLRTLYLPRAFDFQRAEGLPEQARREFGMQRQLDGTQPHSRYYKCRDGQWISLNAVQTKHWETFCEVVDRPAWKERMKDSALLPEMEKLFSDAPSSYWEALTANREVCLYRVVPWTEHLSFSQARPQITTDPLTWPGFAPNPNLLKAPEFGRDTYTVLHSIGVNNKTMADLIQSGIAFQAPSAKSSEPTP